MQTISSHIACIYLTCIHRSIKVLGNIYTYLFDVQAVKAHLTHHGTCDQCRARSLEPVNFNFEANDESGIRPKDAPWRGVCIHSPIVASETGLRNTDTGLPSGVPSDGLYKYRGLALLENGKQEVCKIDCENGRCC